MTPEQERWAEASTVLRTHGGRAHGFVAERVATLASAGDEEGVSRWREVAARMGRLMGGTVQ